MRKLIFGIIIFLASAVLISCGGNKTNKYEDLPEELAKIFIEIDKNPNNPDLYYQRALYYLENKLIDSAYYDAYKALKLDSINPDRYIFLADLYFMQGLFENSEEILERAHEKSPESIEVMMKLAEIQLYYQRYGEMNDFLNMALEKDSRNPQAFFMKGYAFKEQGDTLNAIRNFNKAVDQNSSYYEAYIQLGLMYHSRKDRLALDFYNNALNIRPQSIEAHYNIAIFYQDIGDYAKAKDRYEMITQIDNTYSRAYHNLGWICMEIDKNYEDAVNYFNQAIAYQSDYVDALYNRGVAYEKMGEKQKAIDSYASVINIDSEYIPAHQRILYLEKK